MTNKALHQETPFIVSHATYRQMAGKARSDYLAESIAALHKSIRETILTCTNRLKFRV